MASVGMVSSLAIAQLVAELALLTLHVGLAVFITVQVKNGIVMFRNAFYYSRFRETGISGIQSSADIIFSKII